MKDTPVTSRGADESQNPPPSLSLSDVYFVVFRHKWKIVVCSLLGLVAATVVCLKRPPIYQSEAKILIKYVVDSRPINPVAPNTQISSPDAQGDAILNSELEILTSSDLADQVVDTIGPEKILAQLGGGKNRDAAAATVQSNLKVEVPKNTKVIRLVFRHPDPEIVQPILNQVMSNYFSKHIEMHSGSGFLNEALSSQANQLRSQLESTEAQLRKIKSNAGILSVEEAKKTDSERLLKLRLALDETEANLAGRRAALQRLQSSRTPATDQIAVPVVVSPEKLNEYRNVLSQLDAARKDEAVLLGKYAEESRFVQGARERVAKLEKKKDDLENEIPQLTASVPVVGDSETKKDSNPEAEMAQIAELQGRLKAMRSQYEALSREATNFDEIEASVSRLQREKELLQTNYYFLSTSIHQARFAEALSPGRVSNISTIQTPSPPSKDYSKTLKPAGLALAGGMIGGVLLAFFIELVLDRRIKRSVDIPKNLRLPLFLSIPVLRLKGGPHFRRSDGRALGAPSGETANLSAGPPDLGDSRGKYWQANSPRERMPEAPSTASALNSSQPQNGGDFRTERDNRETATSLGILFRRKSNDAMTPARVVPSRNIAPDAPVAAQARTAEPGVVWYANSPLEPYSEVLRSRIVGHFEDINLTRKPKLVGITSCHVGSGVSSLAASLAASLSQIGDGKVLLVDLNLERGAAHPFYAGKPVIGVSEALERNRSTTEADETNLVLATANDSGESPLRSLPSTLPRQFAGLVPRLKASGYDYIIFDLPPVDQTSITPRVSGFMDLTLLVVESERTGVDVAKQVSSLLVEMKTNVACVLNKTRKYVPAWLQEEL